MNKTGKRAITWLIILGLIFLLALPKLKTIWAKDDSKAANKAATTSKTLEVDALVISRDTLQHEISLAGNVLPDEQVEIRPEVPGRIVSINFKEGTKVRKGQLLVKLNNADLLAQLSKLEADKQTASLKVNRSKQLLAKDAISKEEYEADVNALTGFSANIRNLQAQIAKTSIYAPFDGTIGLRGISEGSFVGTDDIIATLSRINPVKIDFTVPEKYAYKMKPGVTIHFVSEGGGDTTYSADIYAVEPHIDQTTRSLQVRALFKNAHNEIFPGSFARVILPVDKNGRALLIPSDALIPNATGAMVYLYKSGKAKPQQVSTGLRTETEIQIMDGLQPGDTVITSGIIQLKPGSDVQVNVKKE
jgi:membrane fusion protein (multidrug efflux system)